MLYKKRSGCLYRLQTFSLIEIRNLSNICKKVSILEKLNMNDTNFQIDHSQHTTLLSFRESRRCYSLQHATRTDGQAVNAAQFSGWQELQEFQTLLMVHCQAGWRRASVILYFEDHRKDHSNMRFVPLRNADLSICSLAEEV